MSNFTKRIWLEYPIPESVSVWGSDPLVSLDDLIKNCVDEVASDIQITESLLANSFSTQMPDTCVTIVSVKMQQEFQGNRFVKKTYDKETKMLYLRYFPSLVSYKRIITVADLETLVGDRLLYVKKYVLSKMAQYELNVLSSVKLEADNGQVDLDSLRDFMRKNEESVSKLKEDILMYVNSR